MSKRHILSALRRRLGQSPERRELVKQALADVVWWGIDRYTGGRVKGTLKELLNGKQSNR